MKCTMGPIVILSVLVLLTGVIAACQPPAADNSGAGSTAPGASSAPAEKLPDSEVAAWVGDKPIAMKRLDDMIAQMPPFMVAQLSTPEGKRNLVDNLVGVELVYDKAKAEGFVDTPEMRSKIEELAKHLVYAEYVKKNVTASLQPPDETAMKAFYDQTPQLAQQKYEDVKDQIGQHLMRQQEQDAVEKFVGGLRAGVNVKYNDDVLGKGTAPSMMIPPAPAAPSGSDAAPEAAPPATE